MNRRHFVGLVTAAIAVAALPGVAAEPLAEMYRIIDGKPHRIRMQELRPGDRFTTSNCPGSTFVASGDPYFDRVWTIVASAVPLPPMPLAMPA